MSILITICARGGSKGIPGKNIKLINGKPLIAYTIRTAKAIAARHKDVVIGLSTDSEEIKSVAAEYGLDTEYLRPAELATDTAGKIDVIKDLMKYQEERTGLTFDYVLDMDITAPLRTVEDLEKAMEQLEANPEAYNIFSVSPAGRNPYFNMVEDSGDGYVRVVKDGGVFLSRQSAPKVYDMNASFCILRRSYFTSDQKRSTTDKSLGYVVPHLCFDLDEPRDFKIMELILQNNLLDFQL
ncbi:MAG: acylneuraminate cytidylyltransferase family protein [Chitinophagia bacterium]|nr:acylneuraminate cytidylyltransferase family protein [Chitinophagia bacterium]